MNTKPTKVTPVPEMLKLLSQFVFGTSAHGNCGCGVCEARALLAKIEGKSPRNPVNQESCRPEHHDTCPGCVQCGRGQSDR